MERMLNTVWLVITALAFGGIIEKRPQGRRKLPSKNREVLLPTMAELIV